MKEENNEIEEQTTAKLLSPKASSRKREERDAPKALAFQHPERNTAQNSQPIQHPA